MFFKFNCSVFLEWSKLFVLLRNSLRVGTNSEITHIFAYLREFMSFWQNFKNKTIRPIDSSTSRDILIIIKSDVCIKMRTNTFFNVVVESTLKNIFFVILKHTSDIMIFKMSPEIEESIGGSILFLKFYQKVMNSRK